MAEVVVLTGDRIRAIELPVGDDHDVLVSSFLVRPWTASSDSGGGGIRLVAGDPVLVLVLVP